MITSPVLGCVGRCVQRPIPVNMYEIKSGFNRDEEILSFTLRTDDQRLCPRHLAVTFSVRIRMQFR